MLILSQENDLDAKSFFLFPCYFEIGFGRTANTLRSKCEKPNALEVAESGCSF